MTFELRSFDLASGAASEPLRIAGSEEVDRIRASSRRSTPSWRAVFPWGRTPALPRATMRRPAKRHDEHGDRATFRWGVREGQQIASGPGVRAERRSSGGACRATGRRRTPHPRAGPGAANAIAVEAHRGAFHRERPRGLRAVSRPEDSRTRNRDQATGCSVEFRPRRPTPHALSSRAPPQNRGFTFHRIGPPRPLHPGRASRCSCSDHWCTGHRRSTAHDTRRRARRCGPTSANVSLLRFDSRGGGRGCSSSRHRQQAPTPALPLLWRRGDVHRRCQRSIDQQSEPRSTPRSQSNERRRHRTSRSSHLQDRPHRPCTRHLARAHSEGAPALVGHN